MHPSSPTRHSGAPVPWHIDVAQVSRAEAFLWRCAHVRLAGDELAVVRAYGAELEPDEWRAVVAQGHEHGLGPLVYTHCAQAGLLSALPADVREALVADYRESWIHGRQVRGEQEAIVTALAHAGIEVMVVKGVALAARYYEELALRPVSDMDLLVRRQEAEACGKLLEAMGYRPVLGMGDPLSFNSLMFRALVYRKAPGLIVEIHWELSSLPVYLPRLSVEEIWRRADHVRIGGQTVRYLAIADELRYLSFHYAAQHEGTRLIWLVDIAELVRTLPRDWPWPAFVRETIALGLATPVVAALGRAQRILDLRVDAGAMLDLQRAAAGPQERMAWQSASASFRRLDTLTRYILAQRRPRERYKFVTALIGRGLRRWGRLLRHNMRRANTEPPVPAEPHTPLVAAELSLSDQRAAMDVPGMLTVARAAADSSPERALRASSDPFVTLAPPAPGDDAPQGADPGADEAETASALYYAASARQRASYRFTKRCLDVCLCAIGLVVLAPLFCVIAWCIKLDDGGPVLYRRDMVGECGVMFTILKFRSMKVHSEQLLASDPVLYEQYRQQNYKLRPDPRITRVGRVLRRFSLDEFPQLWNILRGRMSLVGPRSIHPSELGLFGEFAWVRHCVPPGLTGLWQISGRSDTTYQERIRLDLEYVMTCSLRRDLVILLRTLPAVLRGAGAY